MCCYSREQNPPTIRALCDVPAQALTQPKASIPIPARGPLLPARPPHPQGATSRAHRREMAVIWNRLEMLLLLQLKSGLWATGVRTCKISNTSRKAEKVHNSLPSLATLPSHPELLGCHAGKAFYAWKGEIPAPPLLRSLSFGQGVCAQGAVVMADGAAPVPT